MQDRKKVTHYSISIKNDAMKTIYFTSGNVWVWLSVTRLFYLQIHECSGTTLLKNFFQKWQFVNYSDLKEKFNEASMISCFLVFSCIDFPVFFSKSVISSATFFYSLTSAPQVPHCWLVGDKLARMKNHRVPRRGIREQTTDNFI